MSAAVQFGSQITPFVRPLLLSQKLEGVDREAGGKSGTALRYVTLAISLLLTGDRRMQLIGVGVQEVTGKV